MAMSYMGETFQFIVADSQKRFHELIKEYDIFQLERGGQTWIGFLRAEAPLWVDATLAAVTQYP